MVDNTQLAPHRGTIVLVLGILSLVVCQILGIFAWIMGNNDLKAMDAGTMNPEGRSITQIGKILGIIATVLLGLGVVIWILIIIGLVGGGMVIESQ